MAIKQSFLNGQTNWDLGEDGLFVFDDLIFEAGSGAINVEQSSTLKPGSGGTEIGEPLFYTGGSYSGEQSINIVAVWYRREFGGAEYEVVADNDIADNIYIIKDEDKGASFYVEEAVANANSQIVVSTKTISIPKWLDEIPSLEGGNGFTEVISQPGPYGDLSAKGNLDGGARPIARWTEIPFITRGEEFYVTVSAYHMEGIDKIEFFLDGVLNPTTIAQKFPHPTDLHPVRHNVGSNVFVAEDDPRFHHYEEYMVKLDPKTAGPGGGPLGNGLHEVRCIVYPVAGTPFVLQGDVGRGDTRIDSVVFADGHHSFWFNVNFENQTTLEVPTIAVGNKSNGDDYDTLEQLFNDPNLQANDPFFQRGGRILLRAGRIHEFPTSGNVMSAINTWNGDNKATYFGVSKTAGTALTIMSDPAIQEHSVEIGPRNMGETPEKSFGSNASIHYKGLKFTVVSNPTQTTCDPDVDPDCLGEIDLPGGNNRPNITGTSTNTSGNNKSLLMENCRFNGDNAIAWTASDAQVIGGGQQAGIGSFFKGCMGFLIPSWVGKWVCLYKNSYTVRGVGDHLPSQPGCAINVVLFGFKAHPGTESPFQHSDFMQYQSYANQAETKNIDQVLDGNTTKFKYRQKSYGSGNDVSLQKNNFQAGDILKFNHISTQEGFEGNTEEFDVYVNTAPTQVGFGNPSPDPDVAVDCDKDNSVFLGTLSPNNQSLTFDIGDDHHDGTYEGKTIFWFIEGECNTKTMRSYVIVDNFRPDAPDNRIFAHCYAFGSQFQPAKISWYGGYNEGDRSFYATNWAFVGWYMDGSGYEPTLDLTLDIPFHHVVFDDMIMRGFALRMNESWPGDGGTEPVNKHVYWGPGTLFSDVSPNLDYIFDDATSILHPLRAINAPPGPEVPTEDWPWDGSSIGEVKFAKIAPNVGLSSNEWNEVIAAPVVNGGHGGIDLETNAPRIETFINPTEETVPEGRIGEGENYWNHSELRTACTYQQDMLVVVVILLEMMNVYIFGTM